ncbi:hypothetical protein EVB91_041 [Rhizobium phage RHph_I1_18]|nr:hypothetical protein EVB91_041 [Rhizobium phage RHph_I1_18]
MNIYSLAGVTSLNVTFSYTAPDQPCSPTGDIFIDFNGAITRRSSKVSTIVLRGGLSNSQYTKSQLEDKVFTLSSGQRVSIMRLISSLASASDRVTITSDNGALQEMCNAIYSNYCG